MMRHCFHQEFMKCTKISCRIYFPFFPFSAYIKFHTLLECAQTNVKCRCYSHEIIIGTDISRIFTVRFSRAKRKSRVCGDSKFTNLSCI